jgi:hypothetical protein
MSAAAVIRIQSRTVRPIKIGLEFIYMLIFGILHAYKTISIMNCFVQAVVLSAVVFSQFQKSIMKGQSVDNESINC